MASTATVLVCLAIPLVFACRNSVMGSSPPPGATAQHVHLRRRCQHAASGMGIFAGYKWFVTEARAAVALLAVFCAIFLVLHQLRRRYKGVDSLYLRLMGPLLRPREIRGELPGAYWFLLGAAGAVALFPRDIALQSILHLTVGDPVASVAGVLLGGGNRYRLLPGGKSVAGSLAAFLVCSVSTLLFFGCCCDPSDEESSSYLEGEGISYSDSNESNTSSSRWLLGAFSACASMSRSGSLARPQPGLLYTYALLGGLSGALGEALPLGVDDNLSMPLVSGGIFLALSRYILVRGAGGGS